MAESLQDQPPRFLWPRINLGSNVHLSQDVSASLMLAWLTPLLVIALVMKEHLPAKYFYDSLQIESYFSSKLQFSIASGSFSNTAAFFQLLGISNDWSAAVVGVCASWLTIVLATRKSSIESTRLSLVGLATAWSVVMTIYLGQLSKDLLVLFLAASFLLTDGKPFRLTLWIMITAIFSIFIRPYWALILCLFIGAKIVRLHSKSFSRWLGYSLFIYLSLAIAFEYVAGRSLTFAREIVNLDRLDSPDANTMVVDILSGNDVVSSWLNACFATASLLFPARLLMFGSAQHIMTAALIVCTFYSVVVANSRLVRHKHHSRLSESAACLLWAFVMTQGLFEPDYGSFLRHLSPISPLILYFLGTAIRARSFPPRFDPVVSS